MAKSKFINFDKLSLQDIEGDAEFIPLMSAEDEDAMTNEELPEVLPILPLRNTVLFPGVVIPITAGRDKSIKLIEETKKGNKVIDVVSQKDEMDEEPTGTDINNIGTVAQILRVLKMPDGNTTVIIQGKKRFQVTELLTTTPYLTASIQEVAEARPVQDEQEFSAIIDSIKEMALKIIKESPNIPSEAAFAIKNIESNSFLINFVASNMNISVEEKQSLLEINDLKERALETLRFMNIEVQKLSLRNDIQSKVQSDINQQQREYFLQQQMRTIQEELGGSSMEEEIEEMQKQAKKKKWGKEVKKHFEKELTKMQRMNPQVAEYSIQRNYLDLLLELPWNEFSKDKFDLNRARKVLDRDHYGLDDVKKRIIEYLAVLKLRNDMKSPILCLYGPPGVGKTSLGKSVAEALGRKYVRISLGGLRDEAEIRGHRKTYIGAMPGRIVQSIKKAGTSNPVFVLDEIDKISVTHQGDPSSAMLEVLDPEQNNAFYDNFLELDYDLSKVMFIATSNNVSNISSALRDRMELIDVSGYIIEEKVEIARRHLIPKQLENHGLQAENTLVFPENVIEYIVSNYTRESGVRTLDKKIASIVRATAKKLVMNQTFSQTLSVEDVQEILGPEQFSPDMYQGNETHGVVTGLAWTAAGGDILFIETSLSQGKGNLTLTGNLGNVMKESATIALEYTKAHAQQFGIKPEIFETTNVHIHVPEGAIPKDGPSAGITMATSIVSAFTKRKVKERIAMTGEITLRGKILPVGGIKEKILAAKRAGIHEIILCADNKKNVDDIAPKYLEGLKFTYLSTIHEVIDVALLKN